MKFNSKKLVEYFKNEDLTGFILTSRGGGKTILLTSLLIKLSGIYDNIFIFSRTVQSNMGYFKVFNLEDNFLKIIDVKGLDIIDMVNKFNVMINEINENKELKILLVFDDIFDGKTVKKMRETDNGFKELFNNGRHIRLSLIILGQYLNYLSPDNRSNLDFFITFKCYVKEDIEKINKSFNPFLEDENRFKKILMGLNEYEPLLLVKRNFKKYFGGNIIINFDKVINSYEIK